MTLIALYRHRDTIRAIADSRLSSNNGTITDHAPKFSVLEVKCLKGREDKSGLYDVVSQFSVGVGYAGSATVALTTIASLQAYLSQLSLKGKATPPTLEEIARFSAHIMESNISDFGALWRETAICTLLLFAFIPHEQAFRVAVLTAELSPRLSVKVTMLPIDDHIFCFGSFGAEFSKLAQEELKTGALNPQALLHEAIQAGNRSDIGGSLQMAIADRQHITLPLILVPEPDESSRKCDAIFLGRIITEKIGKCEIGTIAYMVSR